MSQSGQVFFKKHLRTTSPRPARGTQSFLAHTYPRPDKFKKNPHNVPASCAWHTKPSPSRTHSSPSHTHTYTHPSLSSLSSRTTLGAPNSLSPTESSCHKFFFHQRISRRPRCPHAAIASGAKVGGQSCGPGRSRGPLPPIVLVAGSGNAGDASTEVCVRGDKNLQEGATPGLYREAAPRARGGMLEGPRERRAEWGRRSRITQALTRSQVRGRRRGSRLRNGRRTRQLIAFFCF
jgi:hypothetical protein